MIPLLRLLALQKMPYMASLLFILKPVEKKGFGTFGVLKDGTLWWDPEWAEEVGPRQASGVLLHEAMHLLRNHHDRRDAFNPEHENVWAAAIDIEINDDLLEAGVELPEDGTYGHKFNLKKGQLAESYYWDLEKKAKKISMEIACGCTKGHGHGEQKKPDEGESEEEKRQREAREAAVKRAAQEVIENVADRIESPEKYQVPGQPPGRIPGGLKRLVDVARGKLDWRALLRRYVGKAFSTAGAVDYTYRKLSRRQGLNYGPGAPIHAGLHAPKPKVCVAMDTSGSMHGGPAEAALGELDSILSAVNAQIWFITGDAQVEEQQTIRDIHQAKGMMKGWGGTDFRPVFEAAERQRPDLFVYLTDGYGPAPEHKPYGFDTIWCITPGGRCPVSWGRVVNVEHDGDHDDY